MRERGRVAALAVGLCIQLVASLAAAELIDRVVAAVNNDVITLSELRQAVAFNTAVGGRGDDRRIEAETLEGLVNRRLLLQEAARLRSVDVSAEEVAAEEAALRTRLGTEEDYRSFLLRTGMTEAQLTRALAEQLLVERFVEKKIGLFARANRDEAQEYFLAHAAEYEGMRFPEVQKQIIVLLTRQKAGQQLDQYIAELRSRADIRMHPVREDVREGKRSTEGSSAR